MALFLAHQPRIAMFYATLCRTEALGMVLHAAAFRSVAFAVGFLSWHLYEKRFLRAKRFLRMRAPGCGPHSKRTFDSGSSRGSTADGNSTACTVALGLAAVVSWDAIEEPMRRHSFAAVAYLSLIAICSSAVQQTR